MANLYEGKPDERQGGGGIVTSRFRPKYRQLNEDELGLHNQIKDKATELEILYEKIGKGRYQSLALTSLEESIMWIVKELTSTK